MLLLLASEHFEGTTMPSLSEYTNVYDTALFILREKGYQLWVDEARQVFCAEKDGWDFEADSPCGLLGIVAIFEARRPTTYAEYWWREKDADLYRSLPKAPERAYEPVWRKIYLPMSSTASLEIGPLKSTSRAPSALRAPLKSPARLIACSTLPCSTYPAPPLMALITLILTRPLPLEYFATLEAFSPAEMKPVSRPATCSAIVPPVPRGINA